MIEKGKCSICNKKVTIDPCFSRETDFNGICDDCSVIRIPSNDEDLYHTVLEIITYLNSQKEVNENERKTNSNG